MRRHTARFTHAGPSFGEYFAGVPDATLSLAGRSALEALTLQEGDGTIFNLAIDCTESAPSLMLCIAESQDESVCLIGARCLLLITFRKGNIV